MYRNNIQTRLHLLKKLDTSVVSQEATIFGKVTVISTWRPRVLVLWYTLVPTRYYYYTVSSHQKRKDKASYHIMFWF
jgi:hypothetical protein